MLYIQALAAPDTINTMPEETLLAFAKHGEVGNLLPRDGGDAEPLLREFAQAGIDIDGLPVKLQSEGAKLFGASWDDLMRTLVSKGSALGQSASRAAAS